MRPDHGTLSARLGFPPRLLLIGLALAGCSTDTTAPEERPSDELVTLRLDPNGPQLYNREVSFYAKVGEDTEGSIYFRGPQGQDRKSTRLNSSHRTISYAVFCLKKKTSV